MRRSVAVVTLVLAAACSREAAEPPAGPAATTPPLGAVSAPPEVECPDVDAVSGAPGPVPLWPAAGAGDLVPDMTSACEQPVAPEAFELLNEDPAWTGDGVEAAGFGVLHRGGVSLATFRTARLREPVLPEYEEQARSAGLATTKAGDVTLAWGRSGDHVSVTWLDGPQLVNLTADGDSAAAYAVTLWLTAQGGEGAGVALPPEIPEVTEMPRAIGNGPAVSSLPEGYTALAVDPAAFKGSAFVDSVRLDDRVSSLGAAIVVDADDRVVGTVVAAEGPARVAGAANELRKEGVPVATVAAGGTAAFVVGSDQAALDALAEAWEESLAG